MQLPVYCTTQNPTGNKRMEPKKHITVQELKRRYTYDPNTGYLLWKSTPHPNAKNCYQGGVACYLKEYPTGRKVRAVNISGHMILAHRVVWVLEHGEYPPQYTDHLNGDSSDNRLENLQEATHHKNMQNKSMYKQNTTGVMGVTVRERRPKPYYAAHIYIKEKRTHLYEGPNLFEAICRRKAAENLTTLHENHGRKRV